MRGSIESLGEEAYSDVPVRSRRTILDWEIVLLLAELPRTEMLPNWIRKGEWEVSFESLIDEVYRTRTVRDSQGNVYELSSEVDRQEGEYLLDLISSDSSIVKSIEVGCAYGLSSLYICEGLKNRLGASHTIIDPSQGDVWHDVGIAQLERFGFDFFDLMRVPSELALPQLLLTESEKFDFAFIDGWHTFDQTMLDLYYASRLIRVGGYIVTDDCNWPSVSAAIAYYSNYPMFTRGEESSQLRGNRTSVRARVGTAVSSKIPPGIAQWLLPAAIHNRYYRRSRFPSMVALKKIAPDLRDWAWFKDF